jgi:methionine-rich copper-binding protein CopC
MGQLVIRWTGRLLAALAALALALLVAIATAGPASAHNVLISSDPADGAVLDSAPSSVALTFDQPIQNFDPVLVVTGPNGNLFTDGAPTITGNVISAPLGPAGPAGQYRAAYRIVSADGHPVTGQITYTLSAGAAGTATGTPPAGGALPATGGGAGTGSGAPASSGLGPWLWIGIAVAAVLVVVAATLALRRPREAGDDAEPAADSTPEDPGGDDTLGD